MSQQYDNTNRGVLFKNDKSHDAQPDYTGNINVDGTELRLSAWIKQGRSGKFMSLSVTPKGDQKPAPKTHGQMKQEARGGRGGFDRDDDLDSDIPF